METKMTLNELYVHITNQITSEEALKIFLEGSLIQYKKLKFDEGKEVHPLFIISMAAMDMNWQIAIEKDQDNIRGISTGTKEYMDKFFSNDH